MKFKRVFCNIFILLILFIAPISLCYGQTAPTRELPPSAQSAPIRLTPVPAEDREALLDRYFEQLKDRDVNYKVIGFILEEIAKIQLASIYPSDKYEIIGGLQYEEADGKTAGELDVVVLDRSDGKVELVAECKLSGNLYRASQKAISQLNRFRAYLNTERIARFQYPDNPSRSFSTSQFEDVGKYWKIGNTGATDAGFDYEIDLMREEGDILQQRLLAYRVSSAGTTKPSADVEQPFMANRRSGILHYYTCTSPPDLHNRIYFSSVEEARKAGYTNLHRECMPVEYFGSPSRKALGTVPKADALEKPFIGNRKSKTLHYRTCKSLPGPKNRIYFTTIEEARSAGYTKLHSCIPANLR